MSAAEAQKPAAAQRRSPEQHERAQRQLHGNSAKSSKCNGERSGSSTAAQRNSEVQRRAQRQLHGSAAKISKCNGEEQPQLHGSTERKRTRKGQKPKGGSAVSRTKQSKR
jgi:hypothetical protein